MKRSTRAAVTKATSGSPASWPARERRKGSRPWLELGSAALQREARDTVVVAAHPDVVADAHGRAHGLHRSRLIGAAEPRERQRLGIDLEHRPARRTTRARAHRRRDVVGTGRQKLA